EDTNGSAQQGRRARDCRGSCTANGLGSTGASSALYSPNAILGVVGKISMRRTILLPHFVVSRGTLILIEHIHANRRTQRFAFVDSRINRDLVPFLALGGYITLTGTPAIQLALNLRNVQR